MEGSVNSTQPLLYFAFSRNTHFITSEQTIGCISDEYASPFILAALYIRCMNKIFVCCILALSNLCGAQVLNYPAGSTVPDFTVTDLDGQTHSLYNYTAQGKYVVIDFFAYWCGVCAANAPTVDNFYRTYGCNAGDVVVMGIELEGTNDQVHTFESNAGLPASSFPVASGIAGGGSTVHSAWGVSAFPTVVAIAPNNIMLSNDIWPLAEGAAIYAALQDSTVAAMECVAMEVAEMSNTTLLQCSYFGHQLVLQGELARGYESARLDVFDVTGKLAASFSLGHMSTGKYYRALDLNPLANGIYCATLQTEKENLKLNPIRVYGAVN